MRNFIMSVALIAGLAEADSVCSINSSWTKGTEKKFLTSGITIGGAYTGIGGKNGMAPNGVYVINGNYPQTTKYTYYWLPLDFPWTQAAVTIAQSAMKNGKTITISYCVDPNGNAVIESLQSP